MKKQTANGEGRISVLGNIQFIETTCHEALHKLKRNMPYRWDLNIYRGCQHGCKYCYAFYSQKYLSEHSDFYRDIHVKTNVVEQLEKQLAHKNWNREIINIGGVTDSYQPAEAKYKLMPEILKLCIRYKTPVIISTKSDLILRDYDLIAQLAEITYVNVAASVITTDWAISKKLEPFAAPPDRRFALLREFSKTNASTGLHVMPIIPYMTDSGENFDSLFCTAKDSKVGYVLPGTLYLLNNIKGQFFSFIEREYPHLQAPLRAYFSDKTVKETYKNNLYHNIVNPLREKYGLNSSYTKLIKEKLPDTEEPLQLSLY